MALTHRELASELGFSRQHIGNLVRQGMPRTVEAAKEWLAANKAKAGNRANVGANLPVVFASQLADCDTLEDAIQRLRAIERAYGQAVEEGAKQGYSPELRQTQRDHITAVRALSDAEYRLMRLQQRRGELIPVEDAHGMLSRVLGEVVSILRRLPLECGSATLRKALEQLYDTMLEAIRRQMAEHLGEEYQAPVQAIVDLPLEQLKPLPDEWRKLTRLAEIEVVGEPPPNQEAAAGVRAVVRALEFGIRDFAGRFARAVEHGFPSNQHAEKAFIKVFRRCLLELWAHGRKVNPQRYPSWVGPLLAELPAY
jgi:phage terminase Nu1 subunit (DNA packaging protein)